MKLTYLILFSVCLSCTDNFSSDEKNIDQDNIKDIWEGLSQTAPEETKEWGFALGRWNVTITNHFRNGHKNSGTGTVNSYIGEDSLSIIRRFSVNFNDNSILRAIDVHRYSQSNRQWEMYLRHDNRTATLLGTTGNFNDLGEYLEISPGAYDNFFASNRTWNTRFYAISENEYKVISVLKYDDGTVINDAYTAHFLRF